MFGSPLVQEDPIEYKEEPVEMLPHMTCNRLSEVSSLMHAQTCALNLLANNLENQPSPYILRQLIIGVGSWLLVYHIKQAHPDSQMLFFNDFVGQSRSRLRVQAASCYSRSLGLFGRSGHLWLERHPEQGAELREPLGSGHGRERWIRSMHRHYLSDAGSGTGIP